MWGYNQAYKPTGAILKALTPSDLLPDDAKK
jgi:hypothetical protein